MKVRTHSRTLISGPVFRRSRVIGAAVTRTLPRCYLAPSMSRPYSRGMAETVLVVVLVVFWALGDVVADDRFKPRSRNKGGDNGVTRS